MVFRNIGKILCWLLKAQSLMQLMRRQMRKKRIMERWRTSTAIMAFRFMKIWVMYSMSVASRKRTICYGCSKDADEIDCGSVKLSEDFIVADIAIHPRHAKQMILH